MQWRCPMRAGDERTWHLSDWSWDPASCSAAPNAAAARKRQRTASADSALLSPSSGLVRSEDEASAQPCCSNPPTSNQGAAGCCDSSGGSSGRDGGAVPCSFHLPRPFSAPQPSRGYVPSPFTAAPPAAPFDRPASPAQLPCMGMGPSDASVWPQPPTGLTGFSSMMHEAAAMEAPYFPSYQQQKPWPCAVDASRPGGAGVGDQMDFDEAFDGAGSTARKCTLAELAAAMASGAIALSDSSPADEAEKMTCQVRVRMHSRSTQGESLLLDTSTSE